jgi:DNA-binding CsgD family transcriptional regulator
VLGQADGQLLWAKYSRAKGDSRQAQHYGERTLALASAPRQSLSLLAAHRFLGEEQTGRGQFEEAREHLETALMLADACAAPYERALTLLASAELDRRVGGIAGSRAAIDEARTIFAGLGAAPALAHTTVLEIRLVEQETAMERTATVGLSPREIEVLRLVATGRRNREIAETLFLSVRTVERHLTNLYSKIGAEGRAEAVAFAHSHDLI